MREFLCTALMCFIYFKGIVGSHHFTRAKNESQREGEKAKEKRR